MKKVLMLITLMFLMILISCELKEDASSDGDGTTSPTDQTIEVTSPTSGDSLMVASSVDIIWSSNISQNVNVDLTTNNGKTWISLADNIENVGGLVWDPIPNTVSDQCRIRVMSVDSSVSGLSTGLFSIISAAAKSVEVVSPNGGEVIIVDSEFEIKWNSTSINLVDIELSTDNGTNWMFITESYPADSGYYNWSPVPNSVSADCIIRIIDVSADSLFDISDQVFSISVPKVIKVLEPNGGENWTGNTNQTIRWNSSEVENVKIEYTLNNGVDWFVIVESTESDGFYTWDPIPNQPSSNAKVRITNVDRGFPSDESDVVFFIEPELFITVLSPNGEEEWLSGSGHFIQWRTSTPDPGPGVVTSIGIDPQDEIAEFSTKTGTRKIIRSKKSLSKSSYIQGIKGTGNDLIKSLTDVKIEYSTNNGGTWYTVTESTPNNGNFLWNPVPVHNSVLCVIRISDANDGVPFDLSDNSFTISENPTVEIIVNSPNGGEEWNSGSTQTIAWNSKGITSVDIEYSTNNGVDWITIEDNVPSSGFYNWAQVPNTSSNNCKVRISNADTGVPFDVSNGTFSILPEPGIEVTAPNGGETLQTGTSTNITWTSENIENVKLELTTNNGASWSIIEASTPSDGNYNWTTIPDINSSLCKIRVSDANDGIPSDFSDEVFTISNQVEQTLEIVLPNGGELWEANTSKSIEWQSSGVDSVKIEFSSNNGINWVVVEESIPSLGSYDWAVPDVNSTQAKIKVSDAADGDPYDESNGQFTLKKPGTISLTKPDAGDVWISGELNRIEWESKNVERVKLEYTTKPIEYNPNSITFGDDWFVLSEGAPAALGYYETRFATPSPTYKVRVSDAELGAPEDFSGFFIVKQSQAKTITVLTPGEGEKLFANSSYNITWTSANIEFVNIEFSSNNGATWSTIADSTESDGVYLWENVPSISSSLCIIKISNSDNEDFFDMSAGNFEIINENEYLEVTLPNGGESFEAGTTQNINWLSTGVSDVKIELTTNNGISWSTIVESTPSDGHYTWNQLPLTASTNCKLKISDAEDGMPSDDSDGFFTIAPEPDITIVKPNGGESFLSGTSTKVTWTSTNVTNVKIEYTTNGGAEWITIVASTPSNGSYNWEDIPNLNSTLCQVRLSDADDGAPFDISDSYFTITNQIEQSIEVLVPAGGELWQANTSKLITWASSGINEVKIEFSSNNGISWESIVQGLANTGSYDWTVPNINSTQAKIRISDNADGNPSDESNATFTVKQAGSLQIQKPANGDVWISGETYKIEWTSQNIEKVKIEFTQTDAIYDPNAEYFDDAWFTLTEEAPGAVGYYETRFTTPSNLYKLRISDAQLDDPVDFSGLFTVKEKIPHEVTVISPNGGEKLYAEDSYTIQWNSSSVERVNIDFTSNNGASWNSIVTNTESDGLYTWSSVPNISSSLCKIRISDTADEQFFDESDNNFEVVNQNQLITITSPNGGENWQAGTTQNITWQSTGVQNVKIELTTNNGISWSTIVESDSSDGHYTWKQLPKTASTNCKIKISDADDNMPSDDSDGFFTILPEPDITILSPNGGESFLFGTNATITWTSTNVENVRIEFTTNGGAGWEDIVSSTPSDGSYLWESIPNRNSSLCQVRLSDADDGSPFDISDSYFVITNQEEQTLSILSPNGGEEFEAGTTQNVTWQGTGVANVDVQFTTNNGLSWQSIASNIENSGAVEWSLSIGLNSPQCKVRVKDAEDDNPVDESNGTFTIKPAQSIAITNPAGGQVYDAGDPIVITWNATGIENVGIKYTTTNGLGSFDEPNFYTVTESTPNNGEYTTSFSIPSDQYYIEVYDAKDGSPSARSTGNFTVLPQITNTITILSPNGGESLLQTETHEILWNSQGVERVNIEASTNGGATWITIAQNINSDGIYDWEVGAILNLDERSDNCLIQISDYSSTSIYDRSDSYFSILPPTPKYVRILEPNGGEEIDYDQGNLIVWESSNVEFVNIYITYNNGVTWASIINNYPSNGAYEWNPDDISSNNARIKIEDADSPDIYDISDGTFIIDNLDVGVRPFITIVTPNPNVTPSINGGSTFEITWNNSIDIVAVDIRYSLNNGSTWSNIAIGYTNIGWDRLNKINWSVPATATKSARISIIGYDASGAQTAVGISDPFEIK